MTSPFRSGLILLAGIALLAVSAAVNAIFLNSGIITYALAISGILLCAWGGYGVRPELGAMVRQRRGEIALYTLGVIGVLIMLAYLSARFPIRVDMTEARLFSLSPATVNISSASTNPSISFSLTTG